MALTLHFHPLSSFCHKALIALYENDTPFQKNIVNLMDPGEAAAFKALWPCGQFPVLQDGDRTIPESSVIIEHLDLHHPGKTRFIPADPKLALEVRLKDRFYDLQLHLHMQKVVGDRLRPDGKKDPHGVEDARRRLTIALDMIDAEMAGKTWAMGDDFINSASSFSSTACLVSNVARTPSLLTCIVLSFCGGRSSHAAAR